MASKKKAAPTRVRWSAAAPAKAKNLRKPADDRLIEVRHLNAPPTFVKPKRIHPRHQPPLVVEGAETAHRSRSVHARFEAAAARPSARTMAKAAPKPKNKLALAR